ncbi:hypothetical protein EDC01DRAFT_629278 [Geopyxis carbonaria]|nr:hypothetical protein EDC01DRAFT_629278 [Geopyxis carbonaria]
MKFESRKEMLRSVRGYDRNTAVLYSAEGNESYNHHPVRQYEPQPRQQPMPTLSYNAPPPQAPSYIDHLMANLPPSPYASTYVMGSGCDYHRNTTHPTSNCYTLKRLKREDEEDRIAGTECFHCHQIGHRRFNCPLRRAQRRVGAPESSHSSRRSSSSSQTSSVPSNNTQPPPSPQQYFNGQLVPPFDYAKYNEWLATQTRQVAQANYTEAAPAPAKANPAKRQKLGSRSTSGDSSSASSASDLSNH